MVNECNRLLQQLTSDLPVTRAGSLQAFISLFSILSPHLVKQNGGEYTSLPRGYSVLRKRTLAAMLGISIIICRGVPANGCGDKLLVLGRGIRLEALLGNRPAKILAYQHVGTHGAELIADPEFQSALKGAGFQLRIVRDAEELEVALRLGKYDLVVADVADASVVQPVILSGTGVPALVPILYQPTKPEVSLAEKQYHHVLKSPHKVSGNLSVIERALETKLDAEAKLRREHRKAGGAS
jgi:hypothetical protein